MDLDRSVVQLDPPPDPPPGPGVIIDTGGECLRVKVVKLVPCRGGITPGTFVEG